MGFGWKQCVNMGSPTVINVLLSDGDIDNGGKYACLGAGGVCRKFTYPPLNFAVKGEVLPQKSLILKKMFGIP